MKDLLTRLDNYCSREYVPMHMPGGKRNTDLLKMSNPYGLDITEIDGFDNMHNAQGIIKEAFERAAKVFGADETLFLVNGSSAGIMAAICGATRKRDKVIVARNIHISVANAVYMNELNPVYVYPHEKKFANLNMDITYEDNRAVTGIAGEIKKESIEKLLVENPDARAVIITSPTYEGVVSDVAAIAEIVHRYNCILIVDEAHGAHFHFDRHFPDSAVKQGADLVIQSIHKTLPSLTQTALLHINRGMVDVERVKMYWNMYQTTSPSYILLAAIDRCVSIMQDSSDIMAEYVEKLNALRGQLRKLKIIKLLETSDISKLVLYCDDGKKLYNTLKDRFNIQLEMASRKYVVAMTSVADKDEYYEKFAEALSIIDSEYMEMSKLMEENEALDGVASLYTFVENKRKCSIYDAINSDKEFVMLEKSAGKICAATVCFYPPGIPLINPGEIISDEVINCIKRGIAAGLELIGLEEIGPETEKYNVRELNILCVK